MSDAIVFSCFCLVIGVILTYALRCSKRSIVPLTVALVLLGGLIDLILVSAYDRSIYQSLNESTQYAGPFLSSLLSFLHINPELALSLFLPALIFESASSLKWSSFTATLTASLTLAGPGVLVALAPVSLLAKYAFGYDWNWVQCLILGATLAATDPVAVIALMKVLGVNERFATLIESEALLNDGTAFVLYLVLTSLMLGSSHSIGEAVSQSALGSPLFGLACAIVLVTMLKRVHNDAESTILLTVAFSYAMFNIASGPLEMSSILSLTVMAAYFAKAKDGLLDTHVRERLHHFWAVIGNGVNLCIFLFTGMQVMHTLLSTSDVIGARDWGLAIAIYVLLHVARYASLVMFLPMFKWSGLSLSGKQIVFIGWSGLRGGVSLLLSLIIYLDDRYDPLFRSRFMFHVSCQVLFTLAINGMTAQYVLKACKLHSDTLERRAVVTSAMLRIQVRTSKRISEMKAMPLYQSIDWSLIDAFFVPASDQDCGEDREWEHVDEMLDTNDLANHQSLNQSSDEEIVNPPLGVNQSFDQSVSLSQSTSPRNNMSTQASSLSFNQTSNQSINQTSNQSINQTSNQSVYLLNTQAMAMNKAINSGTVSGTVNESANQYTTPFNRPMSPSTVVNNRSVTGQLSLRMARTLGVDFEHQFNQSLIGPDAYAILIAASTDAVNEESVEVIWRSVRRRCQLSKFDRWLERVSETMNQSSPVSSSAIPLIGRSIDRFYRWVSRRLLLWSSNRRFHADCVALECASAVMQARASVSAASDALHHWDRADRDYDDAPSIEHVKRHSQQLYAAARMCWLDGPDRARQRVVTRQAAASLFALERQKVNQWGNLGLMQVSEVQATIDDCRERWIRFEAQCHRVWSGKTSDQACQVQEDEIVNEINQSINQSINQFDDEQDVLLDVDELEMMGRELDESESESDDDTPLVDGYQSINQSVKEPIQSINQSIKEPIQSINQSISHPFNQSSLTMHINTTEGLTKDHRPQSINQSINQLFHA